MLSCIQVAEYRSNKAEARRARVAEEQAELDDMQRKQAEEDVCRPDLILREVCSTCLYAQ